MGPETLQAKDDFRNTVHLLQNGTCLCEIVWDNVVSTIQFFLTLHPSGSYKVSSAHSTASFVVRITD
jgi:hypothetical protein